MGTQETFHGRIAITHKDSEPTLSSPPPPRDSQSPNVLLILLDDMGFANLGCYGSTIETPNMDALAENGLRYTNIHVTPLCSPTRASLLTGRNNHSVGMAGNVANYADNRYPNQQSQLSKHAATLAEMLSEEGYSNFALGKWHLNPSGHNSAAGPRDGWPLQRGFDRYYGYLGGATDQFYPDLTYDNHPVYPPGTPEEGYHLTEDLVDHAIEFISDQKSVYPETPFFMYFALGAMHSPHQAPKENINKYRGRFDDGWDVVREQYFRRQLELGIVPSNTKLPPRNPGVKPFEELSQNEKNFVCRLQEAWAGFLDHTDAQIGRLIEHLRDTNQLDNTVVVLMADNGCSQGGGPYGVMNTGNDAARSATNDGRTQGEVMGRPAPEEDFDKIQTRLDDIGGPKSHCDIPWGWSQVGNTPLKWYKRDTFGGGVRVPLIVHYPSGIKDAGSIRNQFHHVSDITPTILEMVDVQPRSSYRGYDQIPISGTSFAYTFDDKDCPTEKPIQYFEMIGNRGLWLDGWKAVTRHEYGDDYADEDWELYNLDQDFSETDNLAKLEPERLRKMIDLWWMEAGRYGVLPLDDRSGDMRQISQPAADHENLSYHFTPRAARITGALTPGLGQGNWILTADIEVSGKDTEGVIYTQGSFQDGFSFFVQDERLGLAYNASGNTTTGRSSEKLPNGRITVGLVFEHAGGKAGTVTFTLNNEETGSTRIPDASSSSRMRGADIGRDMLAPISDLYDAPFEFTGIIHSVDIRVEPK